MKIISFLAYAASLALLFSCTALPSLEEQLVGKSASQRQEVLTKACHFEAGKGGGINKSNQFSSHVQRMHKICNLLTQEFSVSTKSSQGK